MLSGGNIPTNRGLKIQRIQKLGLQIPTTASRIILQKNEFISGRTGESIRINGKDSKESSASIDTTVQEKNITFPTNSKLHRRIIDKCNKIADKEILPIRQSYARTLKKLSLDQRFRNHPRNKWKARKADRKEKTKANRLVRELERNLVSDSKYSSSIEIFKRILQQKKTDKNKKYSVHEPDVQCISKGKEHKKY